MPALPQQCSPLLLLLVFLLVIVQFLHAFDVLHLERLLRLPGVVNVGPVLPLDQVLDVTSLPAGTEVRVGITISFHGIHSGGTSCCCGTKEQITKIKRSVS